MNAALLDHDDWMLIDAWRCGNCAGLTYDAHEFELPCFCCRCGAKFDSHDYKGQLESKFD